LFRFFLLRELLRQLLAALQLLWWRLFECVGFDQLQWLQRMYRLQLCLE
jgi:hypothetical protein